MSANNRAPDGAMECLEAAERLEADVSRRQFLLRTIVGVPARPHCRAS